MDIRSVTRSIATFASATAAAAFVAGCATSSPCPPESCCTQVEDSNIFGYQSVAGTMRPYSLDINPPKAPATRAPEPNSENWSAIAVANQVEVFEVNFYSSLIVGWGFAHNYPTRQEAEQVALQICQGDGLPGCAVRTTFHARCYSVAYSNYQDAYGWAVAKTQDEAAEQALQACSEAGKGNECRISELSCGN